MENRCDICDKCYHSMQAVYKHRRVKHGIIKKQKTTCKCYHCEQEFTNKMKLKTHINQKHRSLNKEQVRRCRLICPIENCRNKFITNSALRTHLETGHALNLEKEIHEFKNKNEFNQWKLETEEKHTCLYIQETGEKKRKIGSVKYFVCHRAYFPRPTVEPTKVKNRGSNKIGYACPSSIVVSTSSEGISSVVFYSTHIGHQCEIGRLSIPKPDRNVIAGKLAEGVTIPRILGDIRNSALETGNQGEHTKLKRVHLIEQKDLHNIKRDYNITYSTKLHENDAVSVKLWVESFQHSDSTVPVLYYKQQGQEKDNFSNNDFVLILMTNYQQETLLRFGSDKICIDGTHGLNSYGFQLFTILVIDNFGSGVPVAFCISNREDVEVFKLYFRCIKERTGVIRSKVFMSDDAPAFYNAWSVVMGPVEHQLLCSWHVQRNWFKNLSKIEGTNAVYKRSLVFKTLKVLQTEISQEKFSVGFMKFINDLKTDPDTSRFGDYIVNIYSNRVQKWAYCYRPYLGLNTNMHLEALHKKIKYSYLEGKKCKRLDKTLNALLVLLRDLYFENIIRISKKKITYKISKIIESHKKSLHLQNPADKISETEWNIMSSQNSQIYVIEKSPVGCIYNCNLKCEPCNICIHNYKCSCLDNIIHFNICKHIHAVVKQNQLMVNTPTSQCTITEFGSIDASSSIPKMNFGCSNDIDIKARCEMILGLNSKMTMDNVSKLYVIKQLDKVISKMNDGQIEYTSRENVNVNKHLEPQLRFFNKTTKKKPKVPVPSALETNAIRESFLNESSEVVNIHTDFDHTYFNKI